MLSYEIIGLRRLGYIGFRCYCLHLFKFKRLSFGQTKTQAQVKNY
jgi:hypothetical protein